MALDATQVEDMFRACTYKAQAKAGKCDSNWNDNISGIAVRAADKACLDLPSKQADGIYAMCIHQP